MKTLLLIPILSTLSLLGSAENVVSNEVPRIFSVAAFKPNTVGQAPSAAELVAIKAFALSIYNPHSIPAAVNDDELERIGYQLLMTAKEVVTGEDVQKEVCSQALPWSHEPKALEIVVNSTKNGVVVHAESGARDGVVPSDINFVGSIDIGTHVFDDGLIIAWVTKPQIVKE